MWTTRLRLESLSPLSRLPIHTFPQWSPGYFIQGCSTCTLALGTHRGQTRFLGEALTLEGLQAQLGGPQVGGPPGQVSTG